MSAIYLTEEQVRSVLTMEMAITGVEAGLRKIALQEATNIPRTRCQTDHITLHMMSAAAKTLGAAGFKAYVSNRHGTRFMVTVYDAKSGDMLAMMEADHLGRFRTGAASAVATKILSRPDSAILGVYGCGRHARSQIEGVCKVRSIRQIRVFSRDEAKRTAFATEVAAQLGIETVAVGEPSEAARESDIICTATTSRTPVLLGAWLRPGQHINAIGSNMLPKSELDVEVIRRCSPILIDDKEQGRLEAGDFAEAFDKNLLEWADVSELSSVVAGRSPGRESSEQISLFKSLGVAIEDVAVGILVARKAKEAGIGTPLPF